VKVKTQTEAECPREAHLNQETPSDSTVPKEEREKVQKKNLGDRKHTPSSSWRCLNSLAGKRRKGKESKEVIQRKCL
jgi:hypothetical protein